METLKKKIAVIGAGFASLSAATSLAKAGFDVTVFEKNSSAGGRCRKFEFGDFVFDMGPSWYWMPDVFEKYFARFGKKPSDYYHLIRLDPSYRVFYSEKDVLDIPANLEELFKLFENIEPGSSSHLKKFLQEGAFKYDIGMNALVYNPGLSVTELLDTRLVKGIFKMQVFQSMASYVRGHFKDPRLIQLLEFPVLFLGAAPADTPALYSLMNYADMQLGTWYPMGGMYKIIKGLVSLAEELGVRFRFNSPVGKFIMKDNTIKEIVVKEKSLPFDYVVAGADYHHVEQQLLPKPYRQYSEKYWESRAMAPSSLIFYVGVNKPVKNLQHHNLFFDADFARHAKEIYKSPQWPADPLFYVCCPSKTDPTVAPKNHENIFILIPVAPGLNDDKAQREKYFDLVIRRMEKLTGQSIHENILFHYSYAHNDFIADYNAFKGNAYGLANTILQTANLKPSIVNKKVRNLFYTGQLTVPGPGVPPSLISGQLVADELIKRNKKIVAQA